MNTLLPWFHVLGVVISLGTALFFMGVFLPSLKVIEEPDRRMKLIAEALRYFHPLFLLGICITFVSGALRLMDWKEIFASHYPVPVVNLLLWKFGVTLLIFLVAGGQCIGMGLKFGRMANGVIPGDLALQEKYLGKIRRMMSINIVLIGIAMYLGLKLIPMIYGR